MQQNQIKRFSYPLILSVFANAMSKNVSKDMSVITLFLKKTLNGRLKKRDVASLVAQNYPYGLYDMDYQNLSIRLSCLSVEARRAKSEVLSKGSFRRVRHF
jgi:hypothetical protein